MEQVPIKKLFNIEKGSLQSTKNVAGYYTFITASKDWKTHKEYTHDCEALVFAMGAGGSLGRTHYFKGKFIASDLCFVLTPNKKNAEEYPLNLKYYHLYFNFIREKIVADTARGMSKKAINKTNFSNYLIPYISIDEQNQFAEKGVMLSDKIQEIEEHTKSIKTKVNLLLKKMMAESVQDSNSNSKKKQNVALVADDIQKATGLILRRFQRGEMVVAKMLYLAQSIYKVPLNINFTQQKFGPYSTEIRDSVKAGLSNNKGFFSKKGGSGMEVLTLGANSSYLLNQLDYSFKQSVNKYLDEMMPYFYSSDSAGIERLATVCKIIEDEQTTDREIISTKLQEWKPKKFTSDSVERTLSTIKKNGWDKKLLKK